MNPLNARVEPIPHATSPAIEQVRESSVSPLPPRGPREPLVTHVIRSTDPRVWPILLGIIFIGLAIRAWIVLTPNIGHLSDMGFFQRWARGLHEHGIGGFFGETGFCDYPPLWLLIMSGVAHVVAIFDPKLADVSVLQSALKAPACLADLMIAILIYVEGRKWFGGRRAVGASALYFLNPLALYNSAYWGQVDSIHTAFCLLSLVFINRSRTALSGAAAAIAMLMKFQSIAFMPLIIFEVFRRKRFLGVAFMLIGAVVMTAFVTLPFSLTGNLTEVFRRGYVNVIGQYSDLSRSAYNVWWLTGTPSASDLAVPEPIVKVVSDGRTSFPDNASWMLRINWRTVSLAAYSLVVAIILSLYAMRPNVVARFAAAGLLGLAFFLFPTEMHERYALPTIAFLAFWAVTGAWRERIFVLLSATLLLNVSMFLPPDMVANQIAAVHLIIFALILVGLLAGKSASVDETPLAIPGEQTFPRSYIIRAFQVITLLAIVATLGFGGWMVAKVRAAPTAVDDANVTYLSTLKPKTSYQGWKELQRDRSVGGSMIHLGDSIYLRGLGTHSKSSITYEVPEGVDRFETIVGLDEITGERGKVTISIDVDGKPSPDFTPITLTGADKPVPVSVSVKGAKTLTLKADEGGDGNKSDHVDWALARFIGGDTGQ